MEPVDGEGDPPSADRGCDYRSDRQWHGKGEGAARHGSEAQAIKRGVEWDSRKFDQAASKLHYPSEGICPEPEEKRGDINSEVEDEQAQRRQGGDGPYEIEHGDTVNGDRTRMGSSGEQDYNRGERGKGREEGPDGKGRKEKEVDKEAKENIGRARQTEEREAWSSTRPARAH